MCQSDMVTFRGALMFPHSIRKGRGTLFGCRLPTRISEEVAARIVHGPEHLGQYMIPACQCSPATKPGPAGYVG